MWFEGPLLAKFSFLRDLFFLRMVLTHIIDDNLIYSNSTGLILFSPNKHLPNNIYTCLTKSHTSEITPNERVFFGFCLSSLTEISMYLKQKFYQQVQVYLCILFLLVVLIHQFFYLITKTDLERWGWKRGRWPVFISY